MESVKNIVRQYAILKKDYLINFPDGSVEAFSKGYNFLLGGKYGYQYDLKLRGVIVPISDGVTHLIPEDLFLFEEETEVISITKTITAIPAP